MVTRWILIWVSPGPGLLRYLGTMDGLEYVANFLSAHLHWLNAHLVEGITSDIWDTMIPVHIRREVEKIPDSDWYAMIEDKFLLAQVVPSLHVGDVSFEGLDFDAFVNVARSCRLDVLVASSLDNLCQAEGLARVWPGETCRLRFDPFAGTKKQYEVESVAALVAAVSRGQGSGQVVDVGSGKGYLGSFLALQYGLDVLGLDCSCGNVSAGETRNRRLEKSWKGLRHRAAVRAEGGKPKRRPRSKEEEPQLSGPRTSGGRFAALSAFVDEATDLPSMLAQVGMDQEHFQLVGLHTCGDLAAKSLRKFVAEESCRSVVNVGCCYHLMDEEFFRDWKPGSGDVPSSFPMSQLLRSQGFCLGRNARMLACESLDRMAHRSHHQRERSSAAIFYRALLQVIVQEKWGGGHASDVHVGRLAAKATDFSSYVRLALDKIGIPQEQALSEDDIEDYLIRYSRYRDCLRFFCWMRSLVAPAIESVILLDRLRYLHETGSVARSHLVKLFDPVTSPRCYAVVAFKH